MPFYLLPSPNIGEDTLGPTSVTHKSDGLRGMLDAEAPVRIELPRNNFQECLSDIPNGCFPINNLHSQYHMKDIYFYTSYFHLNSTLFLFLHPQYLLLLWVLVLILD
jgi:hypothetical protein